MNALVIGSQKLVLSSELVTENGSKRHRRTGRTARDVVNRLGTVAAAVELHQVSCCRDWARPSPGRIDCERGWKAARRSATRGRGVSDGRVDGSRGTAESEVGRGDV